MKKIKKLVLVLVGAVLMGTMLVACGASKLEGTYKGDGSPFDEITFKEDGTLLITDEKDFSYSGTWEKDGDDIIVSDGWKEWTFSFDNGQLEMKNLDGSTYKIFEKK